MGEQSEHTHPAVATRVSNARRAIDFQQGRSPDEMRHRRTRRNVHVDRLHEIVQAINAEVDGANVGDVYLIAEFVSPAGAANAKRTIEREPHRDTWPALLPEYAIVLHTRITDTGSELWGGVVELEPTEAAGDADQ